MLQLSGMSTLMQATLLNSDPNTLLSACSITIKVCPNTGTIAFKIHLSLRTILFPLTFASGSSANRRRQSAQYNDRRCIIALQFNYRLLCTGNESFRSSCQHDAVSHPIDVFFVCFWMMLGFYSDQVPHNEQSGVKQPVHSKCKDAHGFAVKSFSCKC
jgi:hypothetical protein